jgi:hypothetical protein
MITPVKPSKHLVPVFDRDPDPIVNKLNLRPRLANRQRDSDSSVFRSELDGVIDKIAKRFEKECPIGVNGLNVFRANYPFDILRLSQRLI